MFGSCTAIGSPTCRFSVPQSAIKALLRSKNMSNGNLVMAKAYMLASLAVRWNTASVISRATSSHWIRVNALARGTNLLINVTGSE